MKDVEKNGCNLEIIDGKDINKYYSNYLEIGQPPIPSIDLKVKKGEETIDWEDENVGLDSWVFPMTGDELSDVYTKVGPRLFSRNVRWYQGEKGVNKKIKDTLINYPEKFWYFNNGVTIICTKANKTGQAGETIIRVKDAQVINGQQTVRILHKAMREGANVKKATVLVKLFVIEDAYEEYKIEELRDIVSKIIEGTNTQTAINHVDLKSCDFEQIRIEREFRKLGFNYLRKSGVKEIKIKGVEIERKKLAKAMSSIKTDPSYVRKGPKKLFELHYDELFNSKIDIYEYLICYFIYKFVEDISSKEYKESPEKKYYRYYIPRLLYDYTNNDFRRDGYLLGRHFIDEFKYKKNYYNYKNLIKVTKRAIGISFKFYRNEVKDRERYKIIKPESFFQKEGLYSKYKKFFIEKDKEYKESIENLLGKFLSKIGKNI